MVIDNKPQPSKKRQRVGDKKGAASGAATGPSSLFAQPHPSMRGHTAFLTFATTSARESRFNEAPPPMPPPAASAASSGGGDNCDQS